MKWQLHHSDVRPVTESDTELMLGSIEHQERVRLFIEGHSVSVFTRTKFDWLLGRMSGWVLASFLQIVA